MTTKSWSIGSVWLIALGFPFFVTGMTLLLYFIFGFSTAVGGIHNLGLLQNRTVGIALSAVVSGLSLGSMVAGFVLGMRR